MLTVFGAQIRSRYPHLERKRGKPLEQWSVVRRGEGDSGDVALDCLLVVNTPVTAKASHVKGPHVDMRKKLWTGLFYMRPEEDPTPGGDLELFAPLGALRFDRHAVPRQQVRQAGLVGYAPNCFIGFVNGTDALHAVTARPPTPWARRYVDFVIELPDPVFSVPQMING